jgi:hypothetical protein
MSLETRADGTGVCCEKSGLREECAAQLSRLLHAMYEFLVIPRCSNAFPPAATIVLPPMSFFPQCRAEKYIRRLAQKYAWQRATSQGGGSYIHQPMKP